jgi:hypothetical protein
VVAQFSIVPRLRIFDKDRIWKSEIYGMLRRHGFAPKSDKHKISTPKGCMTTTKLVVNECISLPRERRSKLRAVVHKLEQRAAFDQYDEGLLKE